MKKQKEIANKYKIISDIKNNVKNELIKILGSIITFEGQVNKSK